MNAGPGDRGREPEDADETGQNDPTQAIPRTEPAPATGARTPTDGRYTTGAAEPAVPGSAADATSPPAETSKSVKPVVAGLLGAAVGFGVALLLPLGADDPLTDDAAAAEEIEALESQLEARELEIEDLEARVRVAEAATGDRDVDSAQQRTALDQRAEALDQLTEALQEREEAVSELRSSLAERQQELDQREAELDEREQDLDGREERLDEREEELDDREADLIDLRDEEQGETDED